MLTLILTLIAFVVGTCAGVVGLGAVLRFAVRKGGISMLALHLSYSKLMRVIKGREHDANEKYLVDVLSQLQPLKASGNVHVTVQVINHGAPISVDEFGRVVKVPK